ncbi:GPI-GlcNAc transferase complex, PIG-H component-domain-containing protein [Protomyces lactucae-debilis]|uniref:GPI-GlcNAc transferase complex, PIG-H component-domain-containing protein n=1 Tax=Protomyces lactucae-debilis TaxID=2754530 RepID=A0A1Y2FSK3_PROLT|nr:GPI-GlcNAc transferase complex, PIG-H component-domain-containing protein [Protomyces lactucae-debilis]ORY86294.1 GPI-GlcNAc transferase complex, PIG-H component-domain-containing protein [Protomyces lactucae-debilis]
MSLTVTQNADVSQFVYKQPRSNLATAAMVMQWPMLYMLLLQLAVLLSYQRHAVVSYAAPNALVSFLSKLYQNDTKASAAICFFTSCWLYFCYKMPPTEESLIVMRSVGIQTTTGGSSHFIALDMIQDVVIHEGFKGFQVKFYLAILTKDGRNHVVFPELLPRRRVLERVWRQTCKALFEE